MALGSNRSANMSSGLLLDPLPSPGSEPASVGPRFRPYASAEHHVTKARYITSNDPRGYIPVYEYPLNGQWIMLDMDDGYVLWTGIWKALGNSKADIVKIIDSQPDLAAQLRRVRGGYLKIQGTWMPFEIALRLARRVAWPIRHDLIPLFGPTFPSTCLSPDHPAYGQIIKPGTGKRRARRNAHANLPADARHDWAVIRQDAQRSPSSPIEPMSAHGTLMMSHTFATQPNRFNAEAASRQTHQPQSDSPVMLHVPYVERAYVSPTSMTASGFHHGHVSARRNSPSFETLGNVRFSPYPSPLSSTTSRFAASHGLSVIDVSPPSRPAATGRPPISHPSENERDTITLPPIQPPSRRQSNGARDAFHLPPISAMDNLQDAQHSDSLAVLRRLQSVDDVDAPLQRRHSLAEPAYKVSDMSFANARLPSLRTPLSASAALPPSSLPPLRHGRDSSSSIAASSLHHSVPRDREAYVSRLSSPPSSSLDAHTASDKVVPTPDDEQYLRSRPTAQNGIITSQSSHCCTGEARTPPDASKHAWRPW